jgi:organic radical activating enzyme
VWCDVKDSWDASKHPLQTVDFLVSEVQKTPAKLVVITGGEPLLHNLDALTAALQAAGFETNIETSGSSPLSGSWNWICLSPKKFKAPLDHVVQVAQELKVVIFNKHDFEWAETFAAQVPPSCKLYLQPEWEKASSMLPLITAYIKENPKWELSAQLHKYINVP